MPNFNNLYDSYKDKLDNGERAQIKRATEPDDLLGLPAFYRLIGHASNKDINQLARFAFFLPLILGNTETAPPLGRQLKNNNISEKRLFHIIRSEYPNDLIQLKRVLQQASLRNINWHTFGNALFYWGKHQKQQLMKDFYLQPQQKEEEK